MKVRSWNGSEEDLPIAHAIYKEVDWADDRDAVEDLRKKLYVLLRIVSELVEHLVEPAAKAVLSEVGWYCRPVEKMTATQLRRRPPWHTLRLRQLRLQLYV